MMIAASSIFRSVFRVRMSGNDLFIDHSGHMVKCSSAALMKCLLLSTFVICVLYDLLHDNLFSERNMFMIG